MRRWLTRRSDLYLAWSLKRSKAVNGTRRVVGVVGPSVLHSLQCSISVAGLWVTGPGVQQCFDGARVAGLGVWK